MWMSSNKFDFLAAFIILPRPFAAIIKRNGDMGSPCWIPLEGMKVVEGDTLIRIEKKGAEMRDLIKSTHSSANPKVRRIANR